MSVGAALRTRLLAVSGVTAITSIVMQGFVSAGTALPYIVIHAIGGSPHGYFANAAAIGEHTYQIDAYAASGTVRDNMAEAIRNAIDGYAGLVGTVSIRNIILDPQANTIEGLDSGRETPIFRARIDARVWFAQAVPTH